jgi:hypothetical protein
MARTPTTQLNRVCAKKCQNFVRVILSISCTMESQNTPDWHLFYASGALELDGRHFQDVHRASP